MKSRNLELEKRLRDFLVKIFMGIKSNSKLKNGRKNKMQSIKMAKNQICCTENGQKSNLLHKYGQKIKYTT